MCRSTLHSSMPSASTFVCQIYEGFGDHQEKDKCFQEAFLTEQVSSILQCKIPVKYKDPGCPTIVCMIGDTKVERALLDLGASVNLLPYSIYVQLGLGELKPTLVTLQLADRSNSSNTRASLFGYG
jgi:hypothetical protein